MKHGARRLQPDPTPADAEEPRSGGEVTISQGRYSEAHGRFKFTWAQLLLTVMVMASYEMWIPMSLCERYKPLIKNLVERSVQF